jgi:hypothetical protein
MMSESSSGLLVSFGGHTLKIVSDSPKIATAIQTHLRHCRAQQTELIVEFNVTASADSNFTVTADGNPLFPNFNYDHTLQLLMTELISRLVAVCESGLIIHAAALAHKGDAVILSGQSASGKSSLAAWLTADGLQYMTDEVVEIPLDNPPVLSEVEGRSPSSASTSLSAIHGLTRSIFLKRGSAFIWQNQITQIDSPRFLRFSDDAAWIDPQLLHPNEPVSTATPRLLLFPRYVADAPLQTEKLTTAETLFRVLQNTTNARNLPRYGMDAATRLAHQVSAYTLTYSTLESASEWIQQTLRKPSR